MTIANTVTFRALSFAPSSMYATADWGFFNKSLEHKWTSFLCCEKVSTLSECIESWIDKLYFLWGPMTHVTIFLPGAAILGLSVAMFKKERVIQGLFAIGRLFESSDSGIPIEATISELSLDEDINQLISEKNWDDILQRNEYGTHIEGNMKNIQDETVPQTTEDCTSSLYVTTSEDSMFLYRDSHDCVSPLRRTKNEIGPNNIPENFLTPKRKCRFESSIPTKDNSSISDADELISHLSELFTELCDGEDFEEPPVVKENTPSCRKNSSYASEHAGEKLPELDLSPISRQFGKPETKSLKEMQELLQSQRCIDEDWQEFVKLNKIEDCHMDKEKGKCSEQYLDRLKPHVQVPRSGNCLSRKVKRRAESLSPIIQRREGRTNHQGDREYFRRTSSVGSKLNFMKSDASMPINFKG